jgi:putative SOS response-associated peptidase YedK
MCGRFAVTRETRDLLNVLDGLEELDDDYNVSPTDQVAVVRNRKGEQGTEQVRWGFVPGWYPDLKKQPQPINARIETVSSSGMFKKAFASGRCIVPALGYYEWQKRADGKQPFFISAPGGALAMAAIATAWRDKSKADDDPARWVVSMAIITRDAHVAPGDVHDRMPALLTPELYDSWLDPDADPDALLRLLDAGSLDMAHELVPIEVSREVNRTTASGAHLIDPLPAA